MENYHFTYRPKPLSLLFVRAVRPEGYVNHNIHMHNQDELIFITSTGKVQLTNNGNILTVNTPALIINRTGSFHETLQVFDTDMVCYVCSIHPKIFSGLSSSWCRAETVLGNTSLAIMTLNQRQLAELLPLLELMLKQPKEQRRFLLLGVFDYLGRLLDEGVPLQRIHTKRTYIFEIAALLQNLDPGTQLTLAELAERFHVSQTKLKTDFKQITGMSVHAYRNQIQLREAKILLESTRLEMAQIAYSCAFNDESYFIRAFRKRYGITPGAYRKQLRNATTK